MGQPTTRADALRRMREERWERNQQLMREAERANIGSGPRPMAGAKKKPARKIDSKRAEPIGRSRGSRKKS